MRSPLLTIGGTAVALAWLAACAQAPSGGPPIPAATPGAAGSTTTAGQSSAGLVIGMTPGELRASQIIGATVYGPRDESLGEVDDLIIEPDGRVSSAVLSVGGFLGFGGKRVAVPIDELKLGKDDHLTVNLTKDQLLAAPQFAYSGGRREAAASTLGSGTGLAKPAPAFSGSSMPPRR
jgi:sporulation protein YlmC with PRC-barrel domain